MTHNSPQATSSTQCAADEELQWCCAQLSQCHLLTPEQRVQLPHYLLQTRRPNTANTAVTAAPSPGDQQLIDAAETAGLCSPRCWGLDHYLNPDPEDLDANRQWIESAPDPSTRAERQQLVDSEAALAADRLAQLRSFAAAIRNP